MLVHSNKLTKQSVAPQYRDNEVTYRRGLDTMDVWFDSGSSWYSVSIDQWRDSPGRHAIDKKLLTGHTITRDSHFGC